MFPVANSEQPTSCKSLEQSISAGTDNPTKSNGHAMYSFSLISSSFFESPARSPSGGMAGLRHLCRGVRRCSPREGTVARRRHPDDSQRVPSFHRFFAWRPAPFAWPQQHIPAVLHGRGTDAAAGGGNPRILALTLILTLTLTLTPQQRSPIAGTLGRPPLRPQLLSRRDGGERPLCTDRRAVWLPAGGAGSGSTGHGERVVDAPGL